MHVAPDRALLPADHQRGLGVGLQVHEPVDDVDARLLELLRPFDIALLVEPRLELDEDEHFLAGPHRLQQRIDDPGPPARPVQRELDGQHVRVRRRFREQALHCRLEGIVRVMDQDVAFG